MIDLVGSYLQPLQNAPVAAYVRDHYGGGEEKKWIDHWMTRGLNALEALVQRSGGPYAVGGEPTMADCWVMPQAMNARRLVPRMADAWTQLYPGLARAESSMRFHLVQCCGADLKAINME